MSTKNNLGEAENGSRGKSQKKAQSVLQMT